MRHFLKRNNTIKMFDVKLNYYKNVFEEFKCMCGYTFTIDAVT